MADIKIQLYKKTGSDFESVLLQNADWYGIPNKPTTFTPTNHEHPISEVTGLQAALDNKAASNHNHDTVYADIEHTHVGSQIYVKSEELGTTLNDWATSIENELSDIEQEVEDAFDELATLMEGV